MAEIQDVDTDVSEIDAVTEQIAEQKADQEQGAESTGAKDDKTEDDIPKKYRGKSVKELIDDLETAKHHMGRYANEAGELRRLSDELIKSQLMPKNQAEQPKEVDFFENPNEAIRRAIESNPDLMEAKKLALQAKQAQAKLEFEKRHPDFTQVLQEKEFGDWIQKSQVRTKLWQSAVNFDVDAADELFGTYKELKAAKAVRQQETQTAVSETEKAARKEALSAASVQTGGTGEVTRKVFRRADLINLRLRDPRKFAAMQDEIDAAYREGRVK